MKKKIYNQPIVEMADVLQPMGTICASLRPGPPVPPGGATPEEGD